MRDPARILVVDDVADNVEILRMRLSSLGYEVVVAEDGEQALARVRDDLPDLVLLDIMMPKIDGLEVVRRMKADTTPALHPGDPGHGQGHPEGRRRRPRCRRRRLSHQADRPRRAGRPRARHAAHQGAARRGAGAEQGPRGQGRGAGRRARARRPAAPLPGAAACPGHRLGRRREHPGQPSPRDRGAVLRPARLHRLLRDLGARGHHAAARPSITARWVR